MPNHTGLSPKDPNKYIGPNVYLTICVTRNRAPTGADYRQPETGKLYPYNSFWLVGKDPTTGVQGDLWYLSKIVSNVAFWVKVSSSSGPALAINVDASTPPGTNPVVADINGMITITGGQVAAGTIGANVIRTDSLAANTFTIEIQRSTAVAAADSTKNGVSHFNSTQFTVTAEGFVSLSGGGIALDSLGVQATSGGGTNPVLPDGTGKIEIQGALVAAGTNPLRSVSTAANTLQMQVQTSQALAAADSTKVGLSNYDSTKFNVDASGFVTLINGTAQGVTNLGIANAAGTTFTVESASGTALSATNVAFVTLQSFANPGLLKTFQVTANQSFTQAGLGNSLFGVTSGVNITLDIPFYLYAVSNANAGENAIAFMISRVPHRTVSPLAANIGQSGNTLASTQGSFFSLKTITAADYASSPCLLIGSFRMQYSSSLWTIQTLSNSDGIGQFQNGVQFAFPRGQFGAASGKWFLDNGGTAPNQDAPAGYAYYIRSSGLLDLYVAIPGLTTAGVGAVNAKLALPFVAENGGNIINGFSQFGGAGSYSSLPASLSGSSQSTNIIVSVSNGGTTICTNATFSASTLVSWQGSYVVSRA